MQVSKFSGLLVSGDLARNNLYEIHFGNIKSQKSFYTPLGRLIPTEDMKFHARSVAMPNKALGTIDVKRFGATFKMANDLIPGDVSVTFSCSEDFRERQFFDGWVSSIAGRDEWTDYREMDDDQYGINEGSVYQMQYYDDYVTSMYIENKSRTGRTSQVLQLIEAYPTNVGSVDLAYGDGGVAVFTVSFAIRDWKVIGVSTSDEALELKYANKTTSEDVLGTEKHQTDHLDDADYRLEMSGEHGTTALMNKNSEPYQTADYLDKADEYYGIHGKELDRDDSNFALQNTKDANFVKAQDDRDVKAYRDLTGRLDGAEATQQMMEENAEMRDHNILFGYDENLDDVNIYANANPIGYIADAIDENIITPLGEAGTAFVDGIIDVGDEVASFITGNPTQSEQALEALADAADDQERMEFISDTQNEWAHIDKVKEFEAKGDMEGLDTYLADYHLLVQPPLPDADPMGVLGKGDPATKYFKGLENSKHTLYEVDHNNFKTDKVSQEVEDSDYVQNIGTGTGLTWDDDDDGGWHFDKDTGQEVPGVPTVTLPINEAADHTHTEYRNDELQGVIDSATSWETGQAEIATELENKSGIGDAIVGFEPKHIAGRATADDTPTYGVDTDPQGTVENPQGTVFFDDDINKYTKTGFVDGKDYSTKVSQNGVDAVSAREPAYSFLHKDNMIEPSATAKSGGVDYTDYGSYINTTYIPFPTEQNYLKNKQRYNDNLHEGEKASAREDYSRIENAKAELDFIKIRNKAIDSEQDIIYGGQNMTENMMMMDIDNDALNDADMFEIRDDYFAERKEILTNIINEKEDNTLGNKGNTGGTEVQGHVKGFLPNVGGSSNWYSTPGNVTGDKVTGYE